MLFRDFKDSFLSISKDIGNSAGELVQKEIALRKHLMPIFADMDMEAIGIPEVRAYSKQKLTEGLAPKSINNHLLVLSRFLSVAREERKLTAPKFAIKSLPMLHAEARFLTAEETQQLLRAADDEDRVEWHTLITLALHTGMRIGELLALDWRDVNMFSRVITIRHSLCRTSGLKAPKNGKVREATLTDAALSALITLPNKSGRVFGCAYETAYVAINRIAERAGLPDVGWHTLRHTFASLLVMENIPLITVSRLLGHSSVRITERYAHLVRDKQIDAMATLAMALGG